MEYIYKVAVGNAPHHSRYARIRGFVGTIHLSLCWHGIILIITYNSQVRLCSTLPQVSCLQSLVSSFLLNYPLVSYSSDLPARQLIYVLGLPAHPPTLARVIRARHIIVVYHTHIPPSLRDR